MAGPEIMDESHVLESSETSRAPADPQIADTHASHVIEIISDSGEGAQTAGQTFATVSAKMGNSVWTVEIIPAEIEPPARSTAGASGNRVRISSEPVTNAGDEADIVVAFNEQVLVGREGAGEFKPGAIILIESYWAVHPDPDVVRDYAKVVGRLKGDGYRVHEVPMHEMCKRIIENPQRGKNMFAVGMLCRIFERDREIANDEIRSKFARKGEEVIQANLALFESGYSWAEKNLDYCFDVPAREVTEHQVVMNGNRAMALGIVASGMDVCAMYPITPATSASHFLSEIFDHAGGILHQAEDEIAACAFAIGASYAGKCAVTITSGPGLALKTELLGLASMAEVPLVVIDVQRGGPSTGLPTKVEQGDLLATMFGTPGDAPKVIMAPATIEDCFYSVITARKVAETFRMPVLVLSDATLATGQQIFPRPEFSADWVAPDYPQSPVEPGRAPYDWASETGLSQRFIPGQPGGMHTLTGLAHSRESKVAYDPEAVEDGIRHRSLKLAALQKTLKTPKINGDATGDLLIVGWGSTRGAIEEGVARARAAGVSVSSLHLTFLQPMASGIREILQGFNKVTTIEINYSDNPLDELITDENRRYGNLAWLLRARYLVDVDSWTRFRGEPVKPGWVAARILEQLSANGDRN